MLCYITKVTLIRVSTFLGREIYLDFLRSCSLFDCSHSQNAATLNVLCSSSLAVARVRLSPFRLENDRWDIVAPSLPSLVSDSYQKLALTMIGRKNDDEGAAQVGCAMECR